MVADPGVGIGRRGAGGRPAGPPPPPPHRHAADDDGVPGPGAVALPGRPAVFQRRPAPPPGRRSPHRRHRPERGGRPDHLARQRHQPVRPPAPGPQREDPSVRRRARRRAGCPPGGPGPSPVGGAPPRRRQDRAAPRGPEQAGPALPGGEGTGEAAPAVGDEGGGTAAAVAGRVGRDHRAPPRVVGRLRVPAGPPRGADQPGSPHRGRRRRLRRHDHRTPLPGGEEPRGGAPGDRPDGRQAVRPGCGPSPDERVAGPSPLVDGAGGLAGTDPLFPRPVGAGLRHGDERGRPDRSVDARRPGRPPPIDPPPPPTPAPPPRRRRRLRARRWKRRLPRALPASSPTTTRRPPPRRRR